MIESKYGLIKIYEHKHKHVRGKDISIIQYLISEEDETILLIEKSLIPALIKELEEVMK